MAVSPDSILLQRLQEQPGVDVRLQPDSEALQGVLLQPGLEVGEGVSSTVIGLAVDRCDPGICWIRIPPLPGISVNLV